MATVVADMPHNFDLVGVGLNATDTLLIVPQFPSYGGKELFEEEILSVGGQVASAVVTCQRLGLQTKYVGTVGDDDRGAIQIASLREEGVNIDDVQVREGSATQSAMATRIASSSALIASTASAC